MNELKKIADFLQLYREIYGDSLTYDRQRIATLAGQMPEFILENSNSDDQSQTHPLWEYKSTIENCRKCPLWKTRKNFVFGDGNPQADLLFVGEAPGAEEDKSGIPFVGRAGKLLNQLLAHINLKREEVFIANILKSRPPGNRDPLPEEVEACIPYLHRQIELIRPAVMVALGRIAAQNLLNTKDSLKNMRARKWTYQGVP
ncbi:MAG: uracil-DNA glycosylase, partial [Calditrichia bacterium]